MSTSADLLFRQAPAGSADLVFGVSDLPSATEATLNGALPALTFRAAVGTISHADLSATLPALSLSALVVHRVDAQITAQFPAMALNALVAIRVDAVVSASLPGLTMATSAEYRSYAQRPTVGATGSAWQGADRELVGVADDFRRSSATPAGVASPWADGLPAQGNVEALKPKTLAPVPVVIGHGQQTAQRLPAASRYSVSQDALRDRRTYATSGQQGGVGLRQSRLLPHQDGFRDRRAALGSGYRDAAPCLQGLGNHNGPPIRIRRGEQSPFQGAIVPRAGITIIVIPVTPGRPATSADLLFSDPPGDADLLFALAEVGPVVPPVETIIVPVRTIYVIRNSQSFVLAATGQEIPADNIRLSTDYQSWTWSWSASVPASYLAALQAAAQGDAVEVIATLNGVDFRLAAEKIGRSREFGKADLTVSGRGRAAWLDAPYADRLTRSNPADRTAQQLMAEALAVNGVSSGWAIDWQIADWLVPAGTWNHTGTAMEACSAIAQAVGAYIQSHRKNQVLTVLPKFKAAPWHWAELTPDLELPEDVCTVEGIEWQDKPAYNAIYVSGQKNGVLGHVVRAGTDGGRVKEMVTDPLITHVDAARQRGIAELSDTGRCKTISLSLPHLAETGIILPGTFVRYREEGKAHLGLVRGIEVTAQFPDQWQKITVDSYDV